ncbi:hypothetical protein [Nocardioides sp. SYSU D00065]|uniref:hypothetical protein n=1 Tax=Nocardioides sp. SYSU D00065 TaxID=2817378 RepID=UPI001B3366E7|nr:hypothetical protein [Nocardioides sp. SYSU D00065]
MSRSTQRVVGIVVLLALGALSLPLAALPFDGDGDENWIVVVQLALMAGAGAAVTTALPGLAREGAAPGRRALTGAWWGLLAAFAGVVVYFFLISGFEGA